MLISEIEERLKRFRVGIAGAGGLGSNCAAALVRSGIGTLVIADFDIVEESNLNRQYYFFDQTGMTKTSALSINLRHIRPDVAIAEYPVKLDKENIPYVFSGCDVIVEALDTAEMKEMLIESVQKLLPGTPVVVGSGLAGWGNNGIIKYTKIDDTLYVCGDEISEVSDDLPPMAARVGIVANMQANTVIDILLRS